MMENITYYLLQACSDAFRSFLHATCAMIHWREGVTVPPLRNPLLFKSATSLACEIREGKLKSVDVVQAYIERIEEVDPCINATVDRRFSDALEEATQVDSLVASGNFTKEQLAKEKPFLGVPFTVKLILEVKGCRNTGGCLLFKDSVASEDSPCVTLMKSAGAIVIATTNIPEMGMYIESNNKVHGKTSNPYDTNRTCGGSSGGEGALIGAGGSLIGLGNDLLGSIRIPCHFNGIFGHKPTSGLVPNTGCLPNLTFLGDYIYTGPMCRYASDLITSMNVLASQKEKPINFDKKVDFRKLKICYLVNITTPTCAYVDKEIVQGLTKVVSYFQTQYGVEAREIDLPLLFDINRCLMNRILSRAGKNIQSTMTNGKGDEIDSLWDSIKCIFGTSTFSFPALILFNLVNTAMAYTEGDNPHYEKLLHKLGMELDSLLDENTVLMVATFPTTAPYHHEALGFYTSAAYTGIFNVLGLPVTQCPVGRDRNGMPYGIQIVGRKNNDLLTLACGVEVEKAFGGWVPPGLAKTVHDLFP